MDGEVRIERLSKGNRAKLGLISAVAHRPALLILDEPAAGLDPLIRLEIIRFLRMLAREDNVSIILSSHISDDLEQLADSVLMLHKGQVVEYAAASSLLDKHSHLQLEKIFVNAIGNQHY